MYKKKLHNGPYFIANNVICQTHYSSYVEMCINIQRIIIIESTLPYQPRPLLLTWIKFKFNIDK